MLKLKILFLLIAFTFIVYGLVAGETREFKGYISLFLSLVILVIGIEHFQKGQKVYGLIFIVLFIIYLSIPMIYFHFHLFH